MTEALVCANSFGTSRVCALPALGTYVLTGMRWSVTKALVCANTFGARIVCTFATSWAYVLTGMLLACNNGKH